MRVWMTGFRLTLGLISSVCVVVLAPVQSAQAHESRPAYLEIKERAPSRYDVLWRTPVLSGMRLPVVLKFPDDGLNIAKVSYGARSTVGELLLPP